MVSLPNNQEIELICLIAALAICLGIVGGFTQGKGFPKTKRAYAKKALNYSARAFVAGIAIYTLKIIEVPPLLLTVLGMGIVVFGGESVFGIFVKAVIKFFKKWL